jgi:hypothetical protein
MVTNEEPGEYKLEQNESSTAGLFCKVLVDNFIPQRLICKSSPLFIDKQAVFAF